MSVVLEAELYFAKYNYTSVDVGENQIDIVSVYMGEEEENCLEIDNDVSKVRFDETPNQLFMYGLVYNGGDEAHRRQWQTFGKRPKRRLY